MKHIVKFVVLCGITVPIGKFVGLVIGSLIVGA